MPHFACYIKEKSGAEGRNRTADTTIFSRMLYRLSYLGTEANCILRGCGVPVKGRESGQKPACSRFEGRPILPAARCLLALIAHRSSLPV